MVGRSKAVAPSGNAASCWNQYAAVVDNFTILRVASVQETVDLEDDEAII